MAVGQRLAGVALRLGRGLVFPDYLPVAGYLFGAIVVAKEHIAIRQEPTVLRRLRGKLPFDGAIRRDDGNLVALIIAAKKAMACGGLSPGFHVKAHHSKTKRDNGPPRKFAAREE